MTTKTKPTPKSDEERKEQVRLTIEEMLFRGEIPEDAFPEEYGKALPEGGGWIILLSSVTVGKKIDNDTVKTIDVPHLSIWYAMPYTTNFKVHLHGSRPNSREEEVVYLRQAVINTPDGPVHIWPREYVKVDINRYLEFGEADGLFIHYLSDEASVDESALFYLEAKGIPTPEATRMLLGTLTNPNYCYFTFAPEIGEAFGEGFGSLHLHPINHKRRAAARKLAGCETSPGGPMLAYHWRARKP